METSVTSMTLYAFTRGVLSGWLPRTPELHNAILSAWKGLTSVIKEDGTVDGICMGTGLFGTIYTFIIILNEGSKLGNVWLKSGNGRSLCTFKVHVF